MPRPKCSCTDMFTSVAFLASGLVLFMLGLASLWGADQFEKQYTPMIAYTENLAWVDTSSMLSNVTFFVNRTRIVKTIQCPVYPTAVLDRSNCVFRPGTLFHVQYSHQNKEIRFHDEHVNQRLLGVGLLILGTIVLCLFLSIMIWFMTRPPTYASTPLLLGDL